MPISIRSTTAALSIETAAIDLPECDHAERRWNYPTRRALNPTPPVLRRVELHALVDGRGISNAKTNSPRALLCRVASGSPT